MDLKNMEGLNEYKLGNKYFGEGSDWVEYIDSDQKKRKEIF